MTTSSRTVINKSDVVKGLKNKAKEKDLSKKEMKQLAEEKEFKSKRKLVQEAHQVCDAHSGIHVCTDELPGE